MSVCSLILLKGIYNYEKLRINKFLLDQKTNLIVKNLKGVGFDALAEEVAIV